MKTFLGLLRVPLTLEAANLLVQHLLHWMNLGNAYIDTAVTLLSGVIVFYAAWLVSRATRRISQAVLAGFIVWAFSLALTVLLMTISVFFEAALPPGEGATAIAGLMLSSLLVLPVALAIAAIAAVIARRPAPQ
jgi:hypothetical protein